MTRWVSAWHRYRRQNRFLIGGFLLLLALSAGAVWVLERTHAATPTQLTSRILLFTLWYLDVSLILVLVFILLRNLVRLLVERRIGVLGSRFRTKLVLTYIALSLLPVTFIFLVATNLLQRSIDRWFSSPVEEVLQSGAALAEQLRALVEERLERQAETAAAHVRPAMDDAALGELERLLGVDLLAIYRGPRRVRALVEPRRIAAVPPRLPPATLREPGSRTDRWRGALLVRAWRPVPGPGRVTVVVGAALPQAVMLELERATAAHATFQEMKMERGAITSTTVLVFLAMTLLLLFATVWMGLYLSRRFTEPLLAVAAATQRVAEGDELTEVAVPATDEVAVLVDSFNRMVRRVRASEAEILASNQELSTLLATIPTGVITLHHEARRFRANPAAERLLGLEHREGWRPLAELDRPGTEALVRHLADPAQLERSRQLDVTAGDQLRRIEVSARRLPGGGWVVALDDLTLLVRAQRQAAWSEVARRIAHEIKNPLTPIRLAAERIARHAGHADPRLRRVVAEGCEAIVAHVDGLKELVDAFHQYARMPAVTPRPTPVVRLLNEVAALYRGVREGLEVELEAPDEERTVLVDPVLVRQALVNLMDNAVEAVEGPGRVVLRARWVVGRELWLEVEDTGPGPPDDLEALIQPFYSTKGRGSGMGLAVVHRIVTDHGGTLELERREGGGTVVRIRLPLDAAPEGPDAA